jgi:hypothetical protein
VALGVQLLVDVLTHVLTLRPTATAFPTSMRGAADLGR